ncbi:MULTISPECIES: MarR family transcriptional regulator [unclassified Crossiella]|uniref:MarR family winged helix-turn-helix transcriptional regulator n=1 Tax=unclassified Crossiella TaxID=2620835 RepID=UPI00200021A2|nr:MULTISPECIES: MarR family transcriptional regulator [unclassified Crossiella]MCK2245061.1 MarR family transcriptional regulator [Crossiella sp. S99.2]MCK2258642.1 MarR family transcriptional regulator [Crossiella sp. S99.1]
MRNHSHRPAELAAAVEAAAETLVIVWGRAAESVHPKVSASQLGALVVVERHRSITLGKLAEELGAIPSSASRLCDRLQAAGLLARRSNLADRREVSLELTKDGSRLLAQLRGARQAELRRVLDGMSPAEQTALLAGLAGFHSASGALGVDREDTA